jgi:N-acyl homoserine lactone hydrolase
MVDYMLAELIDTPGTRYEELAGEAEVLPGVILIPTPGHTEGHQSLVVRKLDGTVVVAGQSHDNALTGHARAAGAHRRTPVANPAPSADTYRPRTRHR